MNTERQYRRVMLGLSCSPHDASLIQYATMLKQVQGVSEVDFVHVLPPARRLETTVAIAAEHAREAIATSVAEHFQDVPGHLSVRFDVLTGPLLDSLLQYAADEHVDLMMVGHELSQSKRSALGRRLAMKASSSVWTVPRNWRRNIRRILVPCDFSVHSAEAIPVATSLARAAGNAQCVALYVYVSESDSEYEEYEELIQGHEHRVLADFLASVDTHGIKVQPLFEEGADVAATINRVAARQQADLMVMSTRGRSRSTAILLGSVTEQVICDATVPLLVVKRFGAQLGLLQALLGERRPE